ncbi:MAG: hypothetical protein IIC31_04530 [Chloroflexi bacterium]|nr:hypothetical protein [Chloroflexota bacterium]
MTTIRANAHATLLTALAVLLVLVAAGRGDTPSELRRIAGPYAQDLVRWELTHALDKWLYLALPWRSVDEEARRAAVTEFFALGDGLRLIEAELDRTLAAPEAGRRAPEAIAADGGALQARRGELRATVEETLEAAISGVVDELGIIWRVGPVRWPPVDFTFEAQALVLVRSPLDAIVRLDDVLLEPGVSTLDQIALEQGVEAGPDGVSALVIRLGGLATYPAQVIPSASLHTTLTLASHEWLHHWLAFRPLGRRWGAGGELRSINETVANIAAEDIGDRALERLTGEAFEREPWRPRGERAEPPPGVFDFSREMRLTRTRLDELLAGGLVVEAEAYLEERRLAFVANGHQLRKLNTAFFAFHGTYAGSPAAASPIEAQLRAVRADAAGLGAFLDRVSLIAEVGELEAMAREAGWPIARDAVGENGR